MNERAHEQRGGRKGGVRTAAGRCASMRTLVACLSVIADGRGLAAGLPLRVPAGLLAPEPVGLPLLLPEAAHAYGWALQMQGCSPSAAQARPAHRCSSSRPCPGASGWSRLETVIEVYDDSLHQEGCCGVLNLFETCFQSLNISAAQKSE